MKNVMIASVMVLFFSGASVAQDNTKKVAKMEAKELKHDAKIAKKEAKMEGDYVTADSAKKAKHTAKLVKKSVKQTN
ncbi:hypothetical protein [Spirosoma koreense]